MNKPTKDLIEVENTDPAEAKRREEYRRKYRNERRGAQHNNNFHRKAPRSYKNHPSLSL